MQVQTNQKLKDYVQSPATTNQQSYSFWLKQEQYWISKSNPVAASNCRERANEFRDLI